MSAWRERIDALEPRRRWLFAGAATVIAILALYEFMWYPMQTARDRLVGQLPALRAESEQFHRDATEAERLKASAGSRAAAGSVQIAIDDALNRANVRAQLKSVQSLGPDRAQLTFSAVPFDALVRLLADLGQINAVTVESVQMSASDTGRVNVPSLIVRGAQRGP